MLNRGELQELRHLRRARDLMDREYAEPLDVPTLARRALMSPAHFSRRFRAVYRDCAFRDPSGNTVRVTASVRSQ